jgi:putative transposase
MNTGRHRVVLVLAHLVCHQVRHLVFTGTHLEHVEETSRGVGADFGARLAEFTGEPEHVHLLMKLTSLGSRLVIEG